MTTDDRTEAQIVYERIEELVADGMSNANAIRAVAKERNKKENAVRANQHQYRQKLQRGGPTARDRSRGRGARRRALTVESAVSQARELLERALGAIDGEIDAAKAELDAAKARYEDLATSAKQRKAGLEAKIKVLE